jgi:hypothetical protein
MWLTTLYITSHVSYHNVYERDATKNNAKVTVLCVSVRIFPIVKHCIRITPLGETFLL